MAKKYTRKQVSSLAELDREQLRIRNKVRHLEGDALELFSPQQLVIHFAGKFLSRKISNKIAPSILSREKRKKAGKDRYYVTNEGGTGLVAKTATRSLITRIGISFLKWQAFNLALFAGRKIVQNIKEQQRRKHR